MEVTIIGGGKLHSSLKALAVELQVSDNIHFIDRLPSADHVREFISKSDLFVLPSRTEGLPRVLIEAMASGIACLGANVGGVPELLGNEWIFRPNDPSALASIVMSVVGNPERLSTGARQQWVVAREIAANYSGDDVLSEFLDEWVTEEG
ncbi:hypothetical protein GCM10009720_25570 [Yaniella flava]|uniref:Glycosyl transferase family 1 domain-containing protein n=1 Tax=Yaniella flava TaxID=287930 RepID=A0ABN2UVD3_9MICC